MTERMKNFLADFRDLLEKYDASFNDYECYEVTFSISDEHCHEHATWALRNSKENYCCVDAEHFNDYLEISCYPRKN